MNRWILATLAGCISLPLQAASLNVSINQVNADGVGTELGSVRIEQSLHGLVFSPQLKGLEPGIHGFHIHAKPSCDAAPKDGKNAPAEAAGGHWDPDNTGKHGTPWSDEGHRGDLPALYVNADGSASQPVLAPRLKSLDDIKGRALMLHAGADNHSDHPAPLGGGGARIACGVIK